MDVNGINSNVSSVNNAQNSSLDKVTTAHNVNKKPDDSSNLEISDSLRLQRSDLSQSLQNLNQGIASTKIASDGLQNQKEILGKIEEKLTPPGE